MSPARAVAPRMDQSAATGNGEEVRLPDSVRAVLFDLDGTLVPTSNRWGELLGRRLLPLQSLFPDLDAGALGRRVVLSVEMPLNYAVAAVERLGMTGLIQRAADRLRRSKGLATRDHSTVIEGTRDLLEILAERYRLAVVTTRARPEAYTILTKNGLRAKFGVIVTRQDVWLMKPHPAPVLKAAKLLGLAPGECAMVGDTVTDIRSARSAGAYAVGVLSGLATRAELKRAEADLILDRAVDLLGHLPD